MMQAPPEVDLRISPGSRPAGSAPDEESLWRDVGEVLIGCMDAWAGGEGWRRMHGFDASGSFLLERLPDGHHFLCTRRHSDWGAPLWRDFPKPGLPEGCDATFGLTTLLKWLRLSGGAEGYAVHAHRSPVWKVLWEQQPGKLTQEAQGLAPMLRILHAQKLPAARLIEQGSRRVSLLSRDCDRRMGFLFTSKGKISSELPAFCDALALALRQEEPK